MAGAQPVLALEGTAHGQGGGWRKGEDLIDALPYIDALTPAAKRTVEEMIEVEMGNSTKKPSDYLREMPPVPPSRLEEGGMLAMELERVKARKPMAPLDATRYRLDAPAGPKKHDHGAWRAAVDNAHSQLEHQYLRIANLELMLKYGDKNWRAQVQLVDSLLAQYEAELAAVRAEISAVNTDRKLQQTAAGAGLRKEEADYYETLHKNMQIELACDRLEAHMHALRGAQPAGKAAAAAPENGAAAQVAVEVEAAGAAGAAAAEMEVEAAVEAVAAVAVAVEAVAVAGEMETEAEAAAEAEAGVEQ